MLPGDFHHLAFGDHLVDLVYSNSLDHAYELPRVLAEVKRVLRPGGLLMVDAQAGSEQAAEDWKDPWASTKWVKVDDLVASIVQQDFSLVERRPIEVPWNGDSLLFIVGAGHSS